jgi:hypothetical protein
MTNLLSDACSSRLHGQCRMVECQCVCHDEYLSDRLGYEFGYWFSDGYGATARTITPVGEVL